MGSDIRAPRLQVLVNGLPVPGAESAEVFSNGHFAADRFRFRLAAGPTTLGLISAPDSRFEIRIGLGGLWLAAITGFADSISFDPGSQLIDVEGRDLSSLFIERQLEETFSNTTSSEIVRRLAGRHGLAALVTETTTPVGRFYQADTSRASLSQLAKLSTEWDLMCFLAHREGFDLYVSGKTVFFNPPVAQVARVLGPGDCVRLQLEHRLAASRPVEVTVKSWNSKSAEMVAATVSSAGSGSAWVRTIVRPNITVSDAQRLAQQTLADLKRHEWSAIALLPGELTMAPRSLVALKATGTAWDRTYTVAAVERHLDVSRGFTQRVILEGAS